MFGTAAVRRVGTVELTGGGGKCRGHGPGAQVGGAVGAEQHLVGHRIDEDGVGVLVGGVVGVDDGLECRPHAALGLGQRHQAGALRLGESLDLENRPAVLLPNLADVGEGDSALNAGCGGSPRGNRTELRRHGCVAVADRGGGDVGDFPADDADGDHAVLGRGQVAELLPEEHDVGRAAGELRVVDHLEVVQAARRQAEQRPVGGDERLGGGDGVAAEAGGQEAVVPDQRGWGAVLVPLDAGAQTTDA